LQQWPYTYDACDVGTVPNQTYNGLPLAATINGDPSYNDVLSYLPGQKLSRCTCDGESHPGPKHADGTYVGRSAPEIDLFEAQVYLWFDSLVTALTPTCNQVTGEPLTGQVSQSAQWAVSVTLFVLCAVQNGTFWLALQSRLHMAEHQR
jgi:beta-glucan synthesis-associated protein KRE6